MLIKKVRSFFNPENYHGWGKKKKFFEGWLYKIVNRLEDRSFTFTHGVAMDETGQRQSFIQIVDGQNKTSEFLTFPFEYFQASSSKYEVRINQNLFTKEQISIDLPNLKVELKFSEFVAWPNNWYSPGIMGPFSFVPNMELYHAIVSLHHKTEGFVEYKGEKIDFNGGRGFTEKDWGHSFPKDYIWLQCNHFTTKDLALVSVISKTPWFKSYFNGFAAGLWFEGKLIQFTTYNLSKILKTRVDPQQIEIIYENKNYRMKIKVERDSGADYVAPNGGLMEERISESTTASVWITLIDKKNKKVLLSEMGDNAGLEVNGQLDEIVG